MVDEALEYLTSRVTFQPKFTYEIIIVDDGSVDNTYQVGVIFSSDFSSRLHFRTQKRTPLMLSGF